MEKGKKRMAVLVGCNYPNTQNVLHGCINDVLAMKEVLLLTDAPGSLISDSCHSGGLIDKEKEQIGFSHNPKAIAYESILQHITSLTNINKSDPGTHSLEFFGSDASLKFRLPPLEWDLFDSLKPDEGILPSGCQSNETSADMKPNEGGGKAYEAFSSAVQMVLTQHSGQLSNKQLVLELQRSEC
ncbi:latex-abundant family protein [Salix suchowensis]|nr:latex-abundant family protein [Salix suchowensis]